MGVLCVSDGLSAACGEDYVIFTGLADSQRSQYNIVCHGGGRCGEQFLMRRNGGAWVAFCLSCIMFDDIQIPLMQTHLYDKGRQQAV